MLSVQMQNDVARVVVVRSPGFEPGIISLEG